jgi:hypothetical protein
MDLNQASKQIAEWMDNKKGIFVFSSKSGDECLYKNFIDHILSFSKLPIYRDCYKQDLSHMNGIKNSIFVDNLMDMRYDWALDTTMNTYSLYKKVVEDVRQKMIQNNQIINTQVIFTPMYSTPNSSFAANFTGGTSIVYMADLMGIIHEDQFSIQKCRWQNSDDFPDINLRVLMRDIKIEKILN